MVEEGKGEEGGVLCVCDTMWEGVYLCVSGELCCLVLFKVYMFDDSLGGYLCVLCGWIED